MKVYLYNEITKEYIGEDEAFIDPLESEKQGKDVYALPSNGTIEKPMEAKEGYAICFNNGWEYVEDHRGQKIISDNGIEVCNFIGPLKDGYIVITDEQIIELNNGDLIFENGHLREPTEEEEKERATKEAEKYIQQYLDDFDWRTTRYQEQKTIGIPTSDSDEEYKNICLYKQYLRDLDKDKNYPYVEILSYEEWKERVN